MLTTARPSRRSIALRPRGLLNWGSEVWGHPAVEGHYVPTGFGWRHLSKKTERSEWPLGAGRWGDERIIHGTGERERADDGDRCDGEGSSSADPHNEGRANVRGAGGRIRNGTRSLRRILC